MLKMAVFALLESQKSISRKIWVIKKSWNFHTVPSQLLYVSTEKRLILICPTFFFLGFSPLLRTLIPTWVIPSKKCTISKVPYNAIPEPSKLIRRLLMPILTWRPYTKTPEIYRKLSNPIVQLWNWNLISLTLSAIWLTVYKSFAIGPITIPVWRPLWILWRTNWKKIGYPQSILTIQCYTPYLTNSENKLQIGTLNCAWKKLALCTSQRLNLPPIWLQTAAFG